MPTAAKGIRSTGKRQGAIASEVGFVSAQLPNPCPAADSREEWGGGGKTELCFWCEIQGGMKWLEVAFSSPVLSHPILNQGQEGKKSWKHFIALVL